MTGFKLIQNNEGQIIFEGLVDQFHKIHDESLGSLASHISDFPNVKALKLDISGCGLNITDMGILNFVRGVITYPI